MNFLVVEYVFGNMFLFGNKECCKVNMFERVFLLIFGWFVN